MKPFLSDVFNQQELENEENAEMLLRMEGLYPDHPFIYYGVAVPHVLSQEFTLAMKPSETNETAIEPQTHLKESDMGYINEPFVSALAQPYANTAQQEIPLPSQQDSNTARFFKKGVYTGVNKVGNAMQSVASKFNSNNKLDEVFSDTALPQGLTHLQNGK